MSLARRSAHLLPSPPLNSPLIDPTMQLLTGRLTRRNVRPAGKQEPLNPSHHADVLRSGQVMSSFTSFTLAQRFRPMVHSASPWKFDFYTAGGKRRRGMFSTQLRSAFCATQRGISGFGKQTFVLCRFKAIICKHCMLAAQLA